mmetsp:Transcript_18073/g.45282  ORF Transcript_18073/g.45282 Transcript_18073/m.45282 type:complete len:939 (-) Transcript_18073:114-2930(-)
MYAIHLLARTLLAGANFSATAFPSYQRRLPNFDVERSAFLSSCAALGHGNCLETGVEDEALLSRIQHLLGRKGDHQFGTAEEQNQEQSENAVISRQFALNIFGSDFLRIGKLRWTLELCSRDSDADGFSNGVELGDPCCVKAVDVHDGGSRDSCCDLRPTNITHPGRADSVPSAELISAQCTTRAAQQVAAARLADTALSITVVKADDEHSVTFRVPQIATPASKTTFYVNFGLNLDFSSTVAAAGNWTQDYKSLVARLANSILPAPVVGTAVVEAAKQAYANATSSAALEGGTTTEYVIPGKAAQSFDWNTVLYHPEYVSFMAAQTSNVTDSGAEEVIVSDFQVLFRNAANLHHLDIFCSRERLPQLDVELVVHNSTETNELQVAFRPVAGSATGQTNATADSLLLYSEEVVVAASDNTTTVGEKKITFNSAYKFEWEKTIASYTPGGPGIPVKWWVSSPGNVTSTASFASTSADANKIPSVFLPTSRCRSLFVNVHYVANSLLEGAEDDFGRGGDGFRLAWKKLEGAAENDTTTQNNVKQTVNNTRSLAMFSPLLLKNDPRVTLRGGQRRFFLSTVCEVKVASATATPATAATSNDPTSGAPISLDYVNYHGHYGISEMYARVFRSGKGESWSDLFSMPWFNFNDQAYVGKDDRNPYFLPAEVDPPSTTTQNRTSAEIRDGDVIQAACVWDTRLRVGGEDVPFGFQDGAEMCIHLWLYTSKTSTGEASRRTSTFSPTCANSKRQLFLLGSLPPISSTAAIEGGSSLFVEDFFAKVPALQLRAPGEDEQRGLSALTPTRIQLGNYTVGVYSEEQSVTDAVDADGFESRFPYVEKMWAVPDVLPTPSCIPVSGNFDRNCALESLWNRSSVFYDYSSVQKLNDSSVGGTASGDGVGIVETRAEASAAVSWVQHLSLGWLSGLLVVFRAFFFARWITFGS